MAKFERRFNGREFRHNLFGCLVAGAVIAGLYLLDPYVASSPIYRGVTLLTLVLWFALWLGHLAAKASVDKAWDHLKLRAVDKIVTTKLRRFRANRSPAVEELVRKQAGAQVNAGFPERTTPGISRWVGVIERLLYVLAIAVGFPAFIAVWFGIRGVAASFTEKDGKGVKQEGAGLERKWHRSTFNAFLIGLGVSLLFGAAGGFVVTNSHEISQLPTHGINYIKPSPYFEEQRAINLVKKSDVLYSNLSVEIYINSVLSHLDGPIDIDGWKAERRNGPRFLVSYTIKTHGIRDGWFFEVNETTDLIRCINGDSLMYAYFNLPQLKRSAKLRLAEIQAQKARNRK